MGRVLTDKGKVLLTFFAACFAVLYIVSAGGCDFGKAEVVKETNETHFLRGQEELRRGNYSEAMSAFMKVTEKRSDAPESHFELGRIYLDHMNDPDSAIYHFKKYLESKPNSQASPMVRQMIETARKRIVASIPESPFENNIRRLELEELLQKVQKENLELKQKLIAAAEKIEKLEASQTVVVAQQSTERAVQPARQTPQQARRQTAQSAQTPAQTPVSVRRDTPSSYVVQPGDTLSSISRKAYGSPNKWREIYNANRDRLATPEALKPGQTLKIPKQQ